MIEDELRRLNHLYELTGEDWVLEVYHSLTEPTCPTVVIRPEGRHIARYRIDTDTIEDGIAKAVEMVEREVIKGEIVGHAAPFSNVDDIAWVKRLQELHAKR